MVSQTILVWKPALGKKKDELHEGEEVITHLSTEYNLRMIEAPKLLLPGYSARQIKGKWSDRNNMTKEWCLIYNESEAEKHQKTT